MVQYQVFLQNNGFNNTLTNFEKEFSILKDLPEEKIQAYRQQAMEDIRRENSSKNANSFQSTLADLSVGSSLSMQSFIENNPSINAEFFRGVPISECTIQKESDQSYKITFPPHTQIPPVGNIPRDKVAERLGDITTYTRMNAQSLIPYMDQIDAMAMRNQYLQSLSRDEGKNGPSKKTLIIRKIITTLLDIRIPTQDLSNDIRIQSYFHRE